MVGFLTLEMNIIGNMWLIASLSSKKSGTSLVFPQLLAVSLSLMWSGLQGPVWILSILFLLAECWHLFLRKALTRDWGFLIVWSVTVLWFWLVIVNGKAEQTDSNLEGRKTPRERCLGLRRAVSIQVQLQRPENKHWSREQLGFHGVVFCCGTLLRFQHFALNILRGGAQSVEYVQS